MTRVLVLTNFYPPHDYGGYEQSCADVMNRLARRGHDVTVLTSRHRRSDRTEAGAGADAGPVAVRRSLYIYWDDQRLIVPSRRRRARWEWHNRRALRRAVGDVDPEVVCVWNMGAMSFGLLVQLVAGRAPLVYAVCNDWLVWGADQDAWMKGWSDRPRLRSVVSRLSGLPTEVPDIGASGTFLFVSDWTRRYAEEHSPWTFPDATVVYSGIESADFASPATAEFASAATADPGQPGGRAGPAGPAWGWRLLFAGRLDPDKGPLTAIQTLVHLPPEATLQLVGPGSPPQRRILEEEAGRLGVSDRVAFDQVLRSELGDRYRQADVFLFPSRWEEPFGLTPLEAMACGTPVVGTCLGGSAEFLADGVNCLCVPREDPPAMAAAVARLADDPELRRRLAANGRRTAAELTTDHLADVFEAWLTAAADGFRDGRPPDRRLARGSGEATGGKGRP